jgi:hypothetical protein
MKDVALPKPAHRGPDGTGSYFDSFTADQLRTYGEACAKAAQPAAQEPSDEQIRAWLLEATDQFWCKVKQTRFIINKAKAAAQPPSAQEPGTEPQGMREDLLMLQHFVDSVIGEFPDIGDIDGFALQDIAESCGLLVKESKTVPCGDHCACAEVVDEGRTTDCMRVQPVLQRARRASALAARASAGQEPKP